MPVPNKQEYERHEAPSDYSRLYYISTSSIRNSMRGYVFFDGFLGFWTGKKFWQVQ